MKMKLMSRYPIPGSTLTHTQSPTEHIITTQQQDIEHSEQHDSRHSVGIPSNNMPLHRPYILQKCGDQPYHMILILLVNFSNYSVLCVIFRFELTYGFARSSVTASTLIVVLSYVIPYVHWRIQLVVSHKECAWMSFQDCYIKAILLTFFDLFVDIDLQMLIDYWRFIWFHLYILYIFT